VDSNDLLPCYWP